MIDAPRPTGKVHAQLSVMNGAPVFVDLTADSDNEDLEAIGGHHVIDVDTPPPPPHIPQNRPERLPWAELPNEETIDDPRNQIFANLLFPVAQEENNPFADYSSDADLALAIQQQFDHERHRSNLNPFDLDANPAPIQNHGDPVVEPQVYPDQEQQPLMQTLEECQLTLLTIFPGICQEHVSKIYQQVSQNSDQLISYVLDRIEKGMPYPKTKKEDQNLKRKRVVSQDEEAALIYGAEDRPPPSLFGEILVTIRNILSNEFPNVPMQFIDNRLAQNQHRLFHTYSQLDEITREYNPNNKPFQKLKKPRPSKGYISVRVQEFLDNPTNVARNPDTAEAYRELQVCRKHSAKAEAARAAERQHLVEETENERRAQADGTMSECGCCFSDFPINRMIHCNAETFHLFCKACARQTAETEIGNSKYEIRCMSMDGCSGGFDNDQRSQFLDGKTIIALERNEQEAMLRMAGIENLASCPFCPFAAEYPPAGVDKEFRCQAPDCERVSCRLCNNESHIPKSCAEFGKEQGLSARRQIEEAMSAAMIRKCNRCATPFIKEQGCNKMTCTRYGCLNIQCYVCSKSCGYDHFDDKTRGGKNGNCPLFENADDRHKLEVSIAEQEALAKVRAEHPEYSEEDLKIRVSESVLEDEKQRKARKPAVMAHANRLNAHIANDVMQLDMPHALMGLAFNGVFPERLGDGQGWQDFPDPPARPPPRRHNVAWPVEELRPRQEHDPLGKDLDANRRAPKEQTNPNARQKKVLNCMRKLLRETWQVDDLAQGKEDAQPGPPTGNSGPQRVQPHYFREAMKIEERAARRFQDAGLEPPGNLFGVGIPAADAVFPWTPPLPDDPFAYQRAHILAPVKKENHDILPAGHVLHEHAPNDVGYPRQIPYDVGRTPLEDEFFHGFGTYIQQHPPGSVPINAQGVGANHSPAANPTNANHLKEVNPPVSSLEQLMRPIAGKQSEPCLIANQERQIQQRRGMLGRVAREEQPVEAQGHAPVGAPRRLDPHYDHDLPNFAAGRF